MAYTDDGITIIDNAIIDSIKDPTEKWIFVCLCRFKNSKTGLCCPSYTTISKVSGFSIRTAKRVIKQLITHKKIKIIKESGLSNHYLIYDKKEVILQTNINEASDTASVTVALVSHSHQCHNDTSATVTPTSATVTPTSATMAHITKQLTKQLTKKSSSKPSSFPKPQKAEEEDFSKLINYSSLTKIGFTIYHLAKIYECGKWNSSNPESIEENIEYFAFDLEHNAKAKNIDKTPLDYFMGAMLSGQGYAKPKNYRTPGELAIEKAKAEEKKKYLASDEFKWAGIKKLQVVKVS